MYVYSAENNAFYPLAMLEDYVAVGAWPDDGIDVDETVFSRSPVNRRKVNSVDHRRGDRAGWTFLHRLPSNSAPVPSVVKHP